MQPAKACERGCRTLPGENVGGDSGAARPPGHHTCDEDSALPEDQARVVTGRVDPTGLVENGNVSALAHRAIELRRISDVPQDPEEIAAIGCSEAR